jgi:hypothetical protein
MTLPASIASPNTYFATAEYMPPKPQNRGSPTSSSEMKDLSPTPKCFSSGFTAVPDASYREMISRSFPRPAEKARSAAVSRSRRLPLPSTTSTAASEKPEAAKTPVAWLR